MKWASAISTNNIIEDCVREAVESIKKELGDLEPHLTTIFVSPHFKEDYPIIPNLIRSFIKPGALLGCSGGGIIGGGSEVEHQPAFSITCAYMPGVDVKLFYSDGMELPDQDTGPKVWRDWIGVPNEENLHFILLADPFSFRGEDFLSGMDFSYPKSRKIGGLASGANQGSGNVLYKGEEIFNSGLVGAALSGNIEVDTIVAQGCRPIGKVHTVTKCQTTFLQEIDSQPPFKVLEELIENATDYDRKLIQTSLFLGVEMNPLDGDPKQGDFLIRNIMGLDRASGAISIGTFLREGQLVQFHLRDKLLSAEDLEMMLDDYTLRSDSESASGALLFSCLGRGQYLYETQNHDSNMFADKLKNVPVGGFFCNGEIGPVGDSTYLHGYTSSFGIFRSAKAS
jgi:small ligand-binding sensory domain FIST